MALSLREMLEKHTVSELQVLLKLAGTQCSGTKSVVIDWLMRYVFGTNLKHTFSLLSPLEQLAVAEAIYNNDGEILPDQIQNKYGQKLSLTHDYFSGHTDKKSKIFLFHLHPYYEYAPIPQELRDKLKVFVPMPERMTISTLEKPSTHNPRLKGRNGVLEYYNAEKTVFHDLPSLLGLIKNEKLKVSPQKQMPTTMLITKINKVLAAPDYYKEGAIKSTQIRGFAWIILLKAAGLIHYRGDVVELTSAGESLLGKAEAESIKKIGEAFIKFSSFDEFTRIGGLSKGKIREYQPEFTDPSRRRQMIVAALSDCKQGQWIRLSDFFKYMRGQYPHYRVASVLGSLNFGNDDDMALEGFEDTWPYLEGTYIKCFFMEYLATLGILEINYHQPVFDDVYDHGCMREYVGINCVSDYDGLYEFRITALGAYCLGMTKEAPPVQVESASEKLFHVMPNLEITAVVDQLFKSDVLLLNMCTDPINEKTWKLSRTKLLNVVEDKNFFLSEFKAFLYSHALSAIPKTVEHFFEDLERRTDQVAYVEESKTYACKDKMLASLIANDTKTKPFCLLAGEHHLIVPLKLDKQFKTALKKVGYITKHVS